MSGFYAMKTEAKCLHTYLITTLTGTGGKVQDKFLDDHPFYFRKTKCRDSTTKHKKCTLNLIKTMGGCTRIFMLSRVNLRL